MKKASEIFDVPSPAVREALSKEPKKGEAWRRGYSEGYDEGTAETLILTNEKFVPEAVKMERERLLDEIDAKWKEFYRNY